ncbi:gametocyte-specific factor 1 homolog [Zeugodacus cucurbitae]|uniref:gametocyte-specific factor 1 homolog n=1 Tax=Zeugodacus cucurbitae TaxID=28588 RepID=UPI0023D94124|nr:gametocyte-specific factor 1 homolog [Zeugodacus cucurbitae]
MEGNTVEDIVTCPYDRLHCVLRKRLQLHLIKCRLNYPHVELRKCPMNQLHLVPEPEFQHHLMNCPDRKIIAHYKYSGETTFMKHEPIESEENWDDTDTGDYNPETYVRNNQIIRQPIGLPSQRKAFKHEEEKRLQQFC